MKTYLSLAVLALTLTAAGAAENPYESAAPLKPANRIDEVVFARWEALGIRPAALCSDAVFLRRVYLDVIGTLPSGFEAQEFLQSRDPNKRCQLIDHLLARPEFVDYRAMKWSDLLRVKAEFPINLWPNAVQAYYRWIHTRLKENLPYDQWARELLTSSGSNFRVGPVNFYRAMQDKSPSGIAQTVALTFLGERADRWPADRLAGLSGFFAQVGYKTTQEWKEEIILFDPARDTNHLARVAQFPDGTPAKLTAGRDPRQVFADWLITPENPWFTRNIANRVWAWLFGRGIVHEPDDLRADNPPSIPELLRLLEAELIAADYDLKPLYRLILTSAVYQLSSIPKTDTPEAAAVFAHYPLRRLGAEVLIDALNQITGSTEEYSSPIPEPFTFIPEDQRSIALSDGSITSAFLEMFGRPSRDTGLESERNNQPTPSQRLHLLNSSHIRNKIERSRLVQYQTSGKRSPREIVQGVYLGVLSRYPTDPEIEVLQQHAGSAGVKAREAVVDLVWALVNSPEFLYRH